MDNATHVLLDPEILTILGGLVVAVGVALKMIGTLIDARFVRPRMSGGAMNIDLTPVVAAVTELGTRIGEKLEASEKATVALLSEIRNGQQETVRILSKEDARGIPRVYCSSPESLEKATVGPMKDIRDDIRRLSDEIRRKGTLKQ
jgi:hypothetical protein